MGTAFPHLHVASGYSLRYGASTPATLVEVAAAQGMRTLALSDRDGLYGAIKFVQACRAAGIAPVLGVDLAVEPSGLATGLPLWADPSARPRQPRRTPVRGGADVDPRHPRVTVLAFGADGEVGRAPAVGWGRLCRLVSATHLRGDRGEPVTTAELIADHAGVFGPDRLDDRQGARTISAGEVPALAVLLGPASEVGRAMLARRPDLARAVLERWRGLLPPGGLFVEIVCHQGRQGGPLSVGHAARMLTLALEAGVPAILTNAVRHATPQGAATVDVLDSARRLVPLDARHLDRVSAQGYLADTAHMTGVAREVARAAGAQEYAGRLLAATHDLAERCRLDPLEDIGLGSVHLPETHLLNLEPGDDVDTALRRNCEAAINRCYPGASAALLSTVYDRLDDELGAIASLGYAAYFLTVDQVCRLIHGMGVRVAARGSGAGSLVNHLLGISGVEPIRHGLLMERFLTPLRAQLPDIDLDVESARRTEVYQAILEQFGAERVTCVSMMDTYRVRHAIRDVGAALGLPPTEVDTIAKSFPHIRARDVRHAIRELPELQACGLGASRLDLLFDLVERLDGLPRHVALHPCGVILSNAGLLDRTPVEASWLGFPMSQFDKNDVEDLGLLKLDVLGIRMQSAMSYALTEIARVDGAQAAQAGDHPDGAPYLDPASGRIDLDAVPQDDEMTFRLIRSTHTLGMFQIESPGQRELVGKFGPETFADLIIDISLFRPGPVKSDMVTPFLRARQGWQAPQYLHHTLELALAETWGVVVFHEQVLKMVSVTTGCNLAEADEVRRAMGSADGQGEVENWWRPLARAKGYDRATIDRIWEVLTSFASFGFCKAHAAAFALPTYHSAWLKAHHPAAFLAGVLTHDPGMYPKRLILDDARSLGIAVLPLDVNASDQTYRVEKVTWWDEPPPRILDQLDPGPDLPDPAAELPAHREWVTPRERPAPDLPDGRPYGIRLSLADVKGISDAEVVRIVAGRPYRSLADFWHRAQASRPVVERLVVAGAFDSLYGLGSTLPVRRRGTVTRRDLLLQVAELDRWSRAVDRGRPRRGAGRSSRAGIPSAGDGPVGDGPAGDRSAGDRSAGDRSAGDGSAGDGSVGDGSVGDRSVGDRSVGDSADDQGRAAGSLVRVSAARQSQAPQPVRPLQEHPVQLALDLGDAPDETVSSGLPEMTGAERVRAELEVLGLDASRHVLEFYVPLLDALGVTRARDILSRRSRRELLVAGVKVATQTPPVRSGRRVVFLTLDDATGPVDATFFEDAQGPYAATVFHSWLLVVRGVLRRTGPRGVSLRATGAWELPVLWDAWTDGGLAAVHALMTAPAQDGAGWQAVAGAAQSQSSRPVPAGLPAAQYHSGIAVSPQHEAELEAAAAAASGLPVGDRAGSTRFGQGSDKAGGMGGDPQHLRRVLVHPSGFRQSPYADIKPSGEQARDTRRMLAAEESEDQQDRRGRGQPPRKLWHASPGSSGR